MKRAIVALMAAVALAGCAAGDTPVGEKHPVARQWSWFSYLNGADVRRACVPGAPDRTRLVFNNVYTRQVRVYELTAGANGGARLDIHVQGPTNLFEVIPFLEQKWAWHGKQETVMLTHDQYGTVTGALEASKAFGPPPVGTWVDSAASYWVMIACRDGGIHFNAWAYPSDRWDAAVFDTVLFGMDVTEVPVRGLVEHDRTLADGPSRNTVRYATRFRFEVGETGLIGAGAVIDRPPAF